MQQLADDLWLLSYPLRLLGVDLRRNVATMRLRSGELIIHSTAAFTAADVAAIRVCGRPAWLLDAMLRHDTFAGEGHAMLPEATYLAPAGFEKHVDFPVVPLVPPPAEWSSEVDVLEIEGLPSMRETVLLHRRSRTLIVADLIFNFPGPHRGWEAWMLRVAIGRRHAPGVSRAVKLAVRDRAALHRSLRTVLAWDFDRVIVGHGELIPTGGRAALADLFAEAFGLRLDS